MDIRSFFIGKDVPNYRLAASAHNVLDMLERHLEKEEPLLARTDPGAIVVNALSHLTDQPEEAMAYPLSQANVLEMDWTNNLGQTLAARLHPHLTHKERYQDWEQAWSNSRLVSDLVDITMRAESLRGCQESTKRQVRHGMDQSMYHLLGFYFGLIAVGGGPLLGSLDIMCRNIPNGILLGKSTEIWTGWLFAGR